MAVKPLKDLLKEADEFSRTLGESKTASPKVAVSDEVAEFAQALLNADSISVRDEGFEKTALALNRAEALLQIQTLQKIAQFRKQAAAAGFSPEQIEEAINKIAAKKVHENLRILTAVDGIAYQGKDTSLEKKKILAQQMGQAKDDKDLTKSLGYGL